MSVDPDHYEDPLARMRASKSPLAPPARGPRPRIDRHRASQPALTHPTAERIPTPKRTRARTAVRRSTGNQGTAGTAGTGGEKNVDRGNLKRVTLALGIVIALGAAVAVLTLDAVSPSAPAPGPLSSTPHVAQAPPRSPRGHRPRRRRAYRPHPVRRRRREPHAKLTSRVAPRPVSLPVSAATHHASKPAPPAVAAYHRSAPPPVDHAPTPAMRRAAPLASGAPAAGGCEFGPC